MLKKGLHSYIQLQGLNLPKGVPIHISDLKDGKSFESTVNTVPTAPSPKDTPLLSVEVCIGIEKGLIRVTYP